MDRHTLRRLILKKGVPAHLPRIPRPPQPNMLRARYFTRLRTLIRDMRTLLDRELVPALPRLVERAQAAKGLETQARRTDGLREDAGRTAAEILDAVAAELAKKWTRSRFKSLVQPIASDTEKFNARIVNKQLEAIVGADVVGSEPWLAPLLDAFANENVALIKTIPRVAFDRIEKDLTRGLADGERWETLAASITQATDVAESDANRIARDQVGKLNGDLNRVRQTEVGIDEYTWRSMHDNRVRDTHADRDGNTYRWDEPPGDPSDPADYGHPGEPIQCRCYAEPNLDKLLSDLDL